MASRERDRNIWKSPGGALFFKLGIPPGLRSHFLSSTGRPKTKISEPLGTDSFAQARILRDQRLAHWQRVFARLAAGLSPEEITTEHLRVRRSTLDTLLALPPAVLTSEEEKVFEGVRAALRARQEIERPAADAARLAEVRRIADEKYGAGIVAEGSPEWNDILRVVVEARIEALKSFLASLITGEPTPAPAVVPTQTPVPVNGNLERFSVALDHYLTWLRDDQKKRPATVGDYRAKAQRFVEFANDPSLGAVTIDMARAFLRHVAETQKVGAATINAHQSACMRVIEHARKERRKFSGENPFDFTRRAATAKSKAKFTVDELNELFGSPTFTEREIKPATHSVASALPWVALIGLYNGATLEEICQLRPQDVRKVSGDGWVIDIAPEAALSGALKRKARARVIPLHPELERLGILKYMRALPRDAKRLFPGLPVPTNGKDKIGAAVGKAFGRWRRKLGIERASEQLDFHSLRHCFGKAIEDIGISSEDRARLMGHAIKGITSAIYSAPELARVAPLVAGVKWDGLIIK